MKKSIFLLTVLISVGLSSCVEKKETKPPVVVVDTAAVGMIIKPKLDVAQDSLLKLISYRGNYQKYCSMRDEMEIKYLRSGKDKYRRLGNRYADTAVIFAKLNDNCHKALDTLLKP